VGIGTTNPSSKLHVQGGYASIYTTGGSNPTKAHFVSAGSNVLLYLYDENNAIKVKIHSDGTTYFNGGNVGIGTTNPSAKLHVHGGYAAFYTTGGSNPTKAHFVSAGGDVLLYLYDQNGDIKVKIDSDGKTYFNGGNVGIGTTTLTHSLTINNDGTDDVLRLIGPDGGNLGYGARLNFGDGDWVYLEEDQDDKLTIHALTRTYFSGGNVGIGDSSPEAKLKVSTGTSKSGYFTNNYAGGIPGATVYAENSSTGNGIAGYFKANGSDCAFIIDQDGSGPIFKGFGSNGGQDEVRIDTDGTMHFYNAGHTQTIMIDPEESAAPDGGQITLYNASGVATIEIDGDYNDDGRIKTQELQITGGSDIAEPFDIISEDEILPGMVLSIDKDHPGKLIVSDKAYDRCVAGVVSGAGDIETGLVIKQENSIADGEYPVALAGRVYCLADATYGSIEPGDLLTTSNTPGHAMKVTDHTNAHGTIIGKAMTTLKDGKGLVFVLVSLH
ncbi:MAG: hypothetical protein KAT48_12645, partial [Bacteroidales bacterium]|nr:hypothetical protein [Bacteroidales bacterium]